MTRWRSNDVSPRRLRSFTTCWISPADAPLTITVIAIRTAAVVSVSCHGWFGTANLIRSEEHTSELQSLMRISYAVFCLKKKKNTTKCTNHTVRDTSTKQQ